MTRWIVITIVLFVSGCVFMAGCAQETKSPTRAENDQQTRQATPSLQDSQTKGGNVLIQPTINIYNGGKPTPSGGIEALSSDTAAGLSGMLPTTQPGGIEVVAEKGASDGKAATFSSDKTRATYSQGGLSLSFVFGNVTNGSTTPSVANTASLNGTASQANPTNPSFTSTQQPQTQVNPALAVGMPGSAVSAAANGTAGFGSGGVTGGTTSANPTQTPMYTTVSAPASAIGEVLKNIGSLFQQYAGIAQTISTRPAQ